MTARHIATSAVLVLLLFACAEAQGPAGTAQLTGSAQLAVRRCGNDREPSFSTTVTLLADGTWTAASEEGLLFTGTWVPVGSDGRTYDLFFDAETETNLVGTVTEDLVLLCDAPGGAVVTSTTRKRFALKLNRAHTRAKLALRYVFKGRANNRSGSATYRIRAKGPFTPAG